MRVQRHGDYGFDAPYVPIGFAVGVILSLGIAGICLVSNLPRFAVIGFATCVVFLLSAISFIWTTRRGKFEVWAELVDSLALHGDQHLLNVGCGGAQS
jgi:arsenite methyltransferase